MSAARTSRRAVLAGFASVGCAVCARNAFAQWPNAQQGQGPPPRQASQIQGCMWDGPSALRKLSEVRYELLFAPQGRINQAVGEIVRICQLFLGVIPYAAVYNDIDGPNAFATPDPILSQGTRLDRADRQASILIGEQLIAGIRARQPGGWRSAVAMVVSHELAHVLQFRDGRSDSVLLDELHADYLAGWGLGRMRRDRIPDIADEAPALRFLETAGSDDFTNPTFHGTPSQRQQMFSEGYREGDLYGAARPPFEEGLRRAERILGRG